MFRKSALIIVFLVFLSPSLGFAQKKIPPAAESGLALKMLKKSQPGRWEPPPQPQPEVLIVREDEVSPQSPSPSGIIYDEKTGNISPDKNPSASSPDPKLENNLPH